MILTIVIFIAVLGLLVFVHELGHFLVAKRAGMQVDEFGFGFPPRVVGVYRSEQGRRFVFGAKTPQDALGTVYSINLIPLGGFVKIVGENNDAPNNPNSFGKKPFWMRLATLLAGVVMNAVLAWALISIGLAVGVPTVIDEQDTTPLPHGAVLSAAKVTILDVLPNSPASKGGLQVGDEIVGVASVFSSVARPTDNTVDSVRSYITDHKSQDLIFTVQRGGNIKPLSVTPNANPEPGQGPTGISLGMVGKLRYPWYMAPIEGAKVTARQLYEVVAGLGKLVSGGVSLNQVGGPVKIAQLTGEASRLGIIYLLQFAAFLSLNLAVLNSLPIPALDGGRVLFLIIEKLRGRPNNPNIEQGVNAIGFLALLLLMLVVTINDFHGFSAIGKLFH